MLAGTVFPASYTAREPWDNWHCPGDSRPEHWRGQQGKGQKAMYWQSKTKASWMEPGTRAPDSSGTPAGSWEAEGSQLPWLRSWDLIFSPRCSTLGLGRPQGAYLLTDRSPTHTHTNIHQYGHNDLHTHRGLYCTAHVSVDTDVDTHMQTHTHTHTSILTYINMHTDMLTHYTETP